MSRKSRVGSVSFGISSAEETWKCAPLRPLPMQNPKLMLDMAHPPRYFINVRNKLHPHLSSVDVRPHNRRLLLQILRSSGPNSRAHLASSSGPSPAAVTNVVTDLLQSGLVEDLGTEPAPQEGAGPGRPGSLLALSRSPQAVLSVQIGSGFLNIGVCNLQATLLASKSTRFELPTPPEAVLDLAVGMMKEVLSDAGLSIDDVLGVGVGAPGAVDRTQRINLTSNKLNWHHVHIADHLEKALGVGVIVDHNVRAMAMGEVRYGAGRDLESLAFIYIRTGVGAGLVLGGREYRGGTHGSVELGHLRVITAGLACECGGSGCLETVTTDSAIRAQLLATVLGTDPVSVERILGDDWTEWFVESVLAGNPRTMRIRDDLVSNLASALLNVINLLNPQRIVLGGLLGDLAAIVLQPLRDVTLQQVMPLLRDAVTIEESTFGADAGLIGAATVTLDRYVFGAPLLQSQAS